MSSLSRECELSIAHEFHLDAQSPNCLSARLLLQLQRVGRRLRRVPGLLRVLSTLLKPILGVAEPAGRLFFRADPTFQRAVHGRETITVLSANLWHDWPQHRRLTQRLESFARLAEAEQADIVLLQEVARTRDLRADEWLAHRLGMAYVYSRANGHERAIGFEEGLGVFSRFPLASPRLQQLGSCSNLFIRRLALGAMVETSWGNLLAFSVHLGLIPRQNSKQLSHLRTWITEIAGAHPVLIGGDFNAHERAPQIAHAQRAWLDAFRCLHPHADGATHELRWPWGGLLRRHRLDYVFLSGGHGWRVVDARHMDAPDGAHSDHRAVLVRLAPAPVQHEGL